jgi:DNA repair protein RecN (Recombination protein N)
VVRYHPLMLARLAITDIVLIDRLVLDFGTGGAGLIVFTGETGAGKSILLDSLGLALGARSDAGLVRHGSAQASVTAEFNLPPAHAAHALLQDQALTPEDGTILLRRSLGQDGKSRASINDQPVSVGLLRQCGQRLVEVHGQFESYGLLDPTTHRTLLDAFGGHTALVQTVRLAHAAWQAAVAAETAARAALAQAKADEAYVRAALAELDALDPQPGEADVLTAQRSLLQQREKILGGLTQAQHLLADHRGATRLVNEAAHAVAKITPMSAPIEQLLATLDRLAAELAEADSAIDGLLHDDALDPSQLNGTEERLFALRAAARKHQTTVDHLPSTRSALADKLDLLAQQDHQLAALAKTTQQTRAQFMQSCQALGAARDTAGTDLAAAVNAELPALKLGQARLQVTLTALPEAEWGALGSERVLFLGQTNPGTAAGALQKIASGGELARFMLALKVALAAADPVPTLVFDEVDAGIGGATAAAVGERLARLAKDTQVMVVTHSPQVAARATQHWRVAKATVAGITTTQITLLDAAARQEEIARMLAGSAVTESARAAAADLIAESALSANNAPSGRRRRG